MTAFAEGEFSGSCTVSFTVQRKFFLLRRQMTQVGSSTLTKASFGINASDGTHSAVCSLANTSAESTALTKPMPLEASSGLTSMSLTFTNANVSPAALSSRSASIEKGSCIIWLIIPPPESIISFIISWPSIIAVSEPVLTSRTKASPVANIGSAPAGSAASASKAVSDEPIAFSLNVSRSVRMNSHCAPAMPSSARTGSAINALHSS